MSTKLNEHIKEIESNIKSIFKETKRSIGNITSKINQIKIQDYISKLEKNNGSLNKFDKYNRIENLMKISDPNSGNGSSRISQNDMSILGSIYLRLNLYKNRMSSYSSIKTNLNELKTKLNIIQKTINQICTKIKGYETNLPDPNKIGELLIMCLYLKDNIINKLKEYENDFYKLEQIGEHTRSLKSYCSSRFKEKLDPGFCEAVDSLNDIYITQSQFLSSIYNIRSQMNYIIAELKLIKLLIEYRNSLKIILSWSEKLPSLLKNKVDDFLKDSRAIIETLRAASKTIETTINEFNKILDIIRTKDFYKKFHPETSYTSFRGQLLTFTTLLHEASLYLRIVRYIIYQLEIIKSNSTNTVEQIKKKIQEISDLKTALEQLKGIYNDIIIDYIIL